MAAVTSALLALWLCSLAFYVLSALSLRAFVKRGKPETSPASPPRPCPSFTVLKPVRGADEDTYENLESFLLQDYPEYQVIFGVAEDDDPAVEIIGRLLRAHPEADASLVTGYEPVGENNKVCILQHIYARAKYDILVTADSDMRVGRDYMAALCRHFDGPDVGLVTCPYRGSHPGDLGSSLEALTINADFLPSVTLAVRLEGLSFALGATMAVRREALERIGGFASLAGYLADDYQLGRKVKEAGYTLRLAGYFVDSVLRKESFTGFFSHQLRWARTYRVCRPGGYFLSVLTKGTAFSILYLAATGFSAAGWGVLISNLAIRYAQAVYMEGALVRAPGVMRRIWLLPARDVLGFILWFMSFTGRVVRWKDASFAIGRDGRMTRLS